MDNTIIYLLGFPGVGKLTIARELAAAMGARVVDNHVINNPIFGIIDLPDGARVPDEAWAPIHIIRKTVFDAIKNIAPPHFSFVFTNLLLEEDPIDHDIFAQVLGIADIRQALFVPVRLHCDPEENMRRMASPARRERLKPTKPEILLHLDKKKLINVAHAHVFNLDVTHLTPQQSVQAILAHIERLAT